MPYRGAAFARQSDLPLHTGATTAEEVFLQTGTFASLHFA